MAWLCYYKKDSSDQLEGTVGETPAARYRQRFTLELNPLLRPNPRLKRMLHLSHLCNQIRGFD